MIFNPIKNFEYLGYILNSILQTEFSGKRPIGNIAALELDGVIKLWLLGLNDELVEVIPQRLAWLELAIERKEDYGESLDFHLMNLHSAAAMYSWMEKSKNETYHWLCARFYNEIVAKQDGIYRKSDLTTIRIDEYMMYCHFAGEYNLAIKKYEENKKNLISESDILMPRDLAYAMCLHKVSGRFDEGEIFSAGRKVLKKNLQSNWMGSGQLGYGAMWLNLLYGTFQPELTPREIVLKAYDNMPKVERPSFAK